MKSYDITEKDGGVVVSGLDCFSVEQVFNCGQCFRFSPLETEGGACAYGGVVHGKYIELWQSKPDELEIHGINAKEYEGYFKHYLALDDDYERIRADMAEKFSHDETFMRAMHFGRGIRILNQDTWETLCSFILSQNNNIPRICALIEQLSKTYGEPIDTTVGVKYDFPTPKALNMAGEKGIFACHTGFRAKYLADAAAKVLTAEIDLSPDNSMSTEELIAHLSRIYGVGRKVASCTALFAYGRKDAFPIDVWMKRVLADCYDEGFDPSVFGAYAGIAQQYLFYYARFGKFGMLEDLA